MRDNNETDEQKTARLQREAAAGSERLKSTPPVPFITGEAPFCGFCGRGKGEYRRLIAGPKAAICDVCVNDAKQQMQSDTPAGDPR